MDYFTKNHFDFVPLKEDPGLIHLLRLNFLGTKMEELKVRREKRCTVQNNVPLITLSDSDSDSSISILVESQNKTKKKKKKRKNTEQPIDLSSSVIILKETCEVSSSTQPESKKVRTDTPSPPGDDFIPLNLGKSKASSSKAADVSVCILDDSVNILEDSVVVIEEVVPTPIPKEPKVLRPIVIDGSNVARAHGQTTNTYSCKGIKIAIEYFLERGHTQVTAFVPNFRRHYKYGRCPTTDAEILETLATAQLVTYTPSRRLNGKLMTCYDDRFIVELASKTDGVILSNDNYKDLIEESDSFKKTIEERLLMFCFVGDMLMIPNDPLGRHGPSLADYLSFPAT